MPFLRSAPTPPPRQHLRDTGVGLSGQRRWLQALLGPEELDTWSSEFPVPFSIVEVAGVLGHIIKTEQNRPRKLDMNSFSGHNLTLRTWERREEFTESFHLFLTWYFPSLIALCTMGQGFQLHKSMVCCS